MAAHLHDGVPHPLRLSQLHHQHHPSSFSAVHMDLARPASNVDEGFSEGTRSPADSDMIYSVEGPDASVSQLLQLVLALPAETRRCFAQDLVRSLPNADKEIVKALIEDLTHFDPTSYFPSEIVLQIFSYLSPKDLLTASCVSHAWRIKSQDERLWQCCFAREGWVLDKERMQAFEKLAARRAANVAATTTRRPVELSRRGSRKRKTEEAFSENEGIPYTDASTARQVSDLAKDASQYPLSDDDSDAMTGVESTALGNTAASTAAHRSLDADTNARDARRLLARRRSSLNSIGSIESSMSLGSHTFRLRPTLFQEATPEHPKLSWPYLYKQRRRLEANWDKGAYKMFQIPHPDFPQEGHEECVYTIQHTSRFLVSGSRDKTIRIWNLDTCRLIGQPLRGHDLSVLCLQFDDRPEQDIIVSGGSDASVIVWRFSTGELIKKMSAAHEESVLNLRFDERYIVTCSKDKTIKIWSRHALSRDDPLIPSHVIDTFRLASAANLADPLQEFTLLATLSGHHAAVNAVMIHENTIVSASGDRTIRAWDIDTGVHKKTYAGHLKGIACVQFDGRRIVSGSSDNTVRIFDAEHQAEIACLTGHTSLVRTIQARFGDLETTTNEELELEARKADRAFFKAVARGMTPALAHRRAQRNPGSSRPEDMQAIGTKIPPGGGGSRWAKIVSGSYDETVILWKRNYEGKWQAKQHFHQDMLLRAGRTRRHAAAAAQAPPVNHNAANAAASTAQQTLTAIHSGNSQHFIAAAQQYNASVNALLAQPAASAPPTNAQQAALLAAQSALTAQLSNPPAATATANNNASTATQQPSANQQQAAPAAATAAAQQPAAPQAQQAQPQAQQQAQHGQHAHHRENNRVFKLQFDARRILCCSQNKIIVGWDFANGDKELERIGEWSLETA